MAGLDSQGSTLCLALLALLSESAASAGGTTSEVCEGRRDQGSVATMEVAVIRQHPCYIDNGLVRMSFYGAEKADLHYSDGSVLQIGLMSGLVKAPFKSIDYRTRRSEQ